MVQSGLMRAVYALALALAASWQLAGVAWAKEFKLLDGSTIYGEVSGFDDYGVSFRLQTGGFSKKYAWMKFTQETLKDLAEEPKVKPLVEPFIEVPLPPKPKPKPIELSEPPRVERPVGRSTVLSSVTTPIGLTALALLFVANLLTGYEIAVYRNRPVALVCGLSAVLPLLGPLLFLASPTVVEHGEEAPVGEEALAPEGVGPAVAAAGSAGRATSRRVGVPPPPPPGLRVAAQEKAAPVSIGHRRIFNRADYTFNRRFIETQFSGFFRIVPLEAEKDLVLDVKTAKKEYTAKRISRISASEMFLQLVEGGGTMEVNVQFVEIAQMIVRHKDDTDKD
jgi:hypothetical protein